MTPTMYGTAAGVAGLVNSAYLDATTKLFTTATSPTKVTVEAWIVQVSAIVTAALADARFVVPITQEDCVNMLTGQVEQAVAELCNYKNQSGRFFSKEMTVNISAMGSIRNEIYSWVIANTQGMENLGAERNPEQKSAVTQKATVTRVRHTEDPYQWPLP